MPLFRTSPVCDRPEHLVTAVEILLAHVPFAAIELARLSLGEAAGLVLVPIREPRGRVHRSGE